MAEDPRPATGSAFTTTRRRFLALMGFAVAGLAAGCSRRPSSSEKDVADPEALGPEPSAYSPPSPETRPEPQLKDPEIVETDVCVVGGGAAGMAAATAAARLGARTLLIEESFVLGGNVTRGLVNLDKVAWGGGLMVRGYFEELLRTLAGQGDAVFPSPSTHWAVRYDTDALRHAALLIAQRAGADIRLGTRAVWARRSGRLVSSLYACEQGRGLVIRAARYVDCTGDGNLGYLAGNTYWYGDRNHGQVQGQTLIFYAAPVDFAALRSYGRLDGSIVNEFQVIGLRPFMKKLRRDKRVEGTPQWGLLVNLLPPEDTVSISASEAYGEHLETGSAAGIMALLEKQNYEIHAGLKSDIPGFAQSRIVRMGERPYLREGRRLAGYHQLTADEALSGEKPDDSVARGWYPIDLHVPYTGEPSHLGELAPGDYYGIPYRCLVARDLDNLLMAGRCISVTHEALGSTRISPTSMALGQAAGIAAALSAESAARPADLPAGDVQRYLTMQGGLY
jgi:hypothetical protein